MATANGWKVARTTKLTMSTTSPNCLQQKQMEKVTVIGHSLGGSISTLYTALHPEKVNKLVAIEGMGPPPKMIEERINQPISKRLHNWMNDLRKSSGRLPRRYQTLEEAFQRMQAENPSLV